MVVLLLAALGNLAQESPGPDQRSVDRAIRQGLAWLRTADIPPESREPALFALILQDVPDADPRLQLLLGEAIEMPLEDTARAAFLAMALEAFDRLRYRPVMACLAQFLVDTQAEDGHWPKEVPAVPLDFAEVPPMPKRGPVREFGAPRKSLSWPRTIKIERKQKGPARGDLTHARLAVLGLLACHRSGIEVPKETLSRAEQAWKEAQDFEGGWRASPEAPASVGMSAAGAACLAVLGYLKDSRLKKDPSLDRAVAWLERHHEAVAGPDCSETLWWLERAAIFLNKETFGSWAWYPALSRTLVNEQKPDGSWGLGGPPTRDSAFALLVLKRTILLGLPQQRK